MKSSQSDDFIHRVIGGMPKNGYDSNALIVKLNFSFEKPSKEQPRIYDKKFHGKKDWRILNPYTQVQNTNI